MFSIRKIIIQINPQDVGKTSSIFYGLSGLDLIFQELYLQQVTTQRHSGPSVN